MFSRNLILAAGAVVLSTGAFARADLTFVGGHEPMRQFIATPGPLPAAVKEAPYALTGNDVEPARRTAAREIRVGPRVVGYFATPSDEGR